MNKVILIGRLTKEPETRTSGDTEVTRFSIAVNRPFKNDNGDYDADFPNCVAFGKTAEFIEKYFNKGDMIAVVGRIQTGSYTNKNGDKVYTTDVVVESAEFARNKKDKDDTSYERKKSKSSNKKRDYDEDDDEYENPKKKRRPDPDDEDDEDEKPRKKRRPEPDDEDDSDYPF